MKQLIIFSISVLFLASCEKLGLEKKDKPCPVLAATAVPDAVIKAFQAKHPGITAKTWFNKDNKGCAALFDSSGKETLDFFDNSGNFQKEEIDGDNQTGNHNDGDDDGCECESGD